MRVMDDAPERTGMYLQRLFVLPVISGRDASPSCSVTQIRQIMAGRLLVNIQPEIFCRRIHIFKYLRLSFLIINPVVERVKQYISTGNPSGVGDMVLITRYISARTSPRNFIQLRRYLRNSCKLVTPLRPSTLLRHHNRYFPPVFHPVTDEMTPDSAAPLITFHQQTILRTDQYKTAFNTAAAGREHRLPVSVFFGQEIFCRDP